jgi:hypothetical protein
MKRKSRGRKLRTGEQLYKNSGGPISFYLTVLPSAAFSFYLIVQNGCLYSKGSICIWAIKKEKRATGECRKNPKEVTY